MPLSPIELPTQLRKDALASLQRYAAENFPEPLGHLPASLLLDYFLAEIGPAIYNQAIGDAQTRLLQRVADLSGELFADPLTYWPKLDAKRKKR